MKNVIVIVAILIIGLAAWAFIRSRQVAQSRQDIEEQVAAMQRQQEDLNTSLDKRLARAKAEREGTYVPQPGTPLPEPIKVGETSKYRVVILCGTPDDKETVETANEYREVYTYDDPDGRAYECLGKFTFVNNRLESISR